MVESRKNCTQAFLIISVDISLPFLPPISNPFSKSRTCRIVERINRFVVQVEMGGKLSRAHINKSGRLHEFLIRGKKAFCFETPHTAKTGFRLFAVEEKNLGALIDTQLQMKAFETAQKQALIPWLHGDVLVRRNAKLGESLIDYFFQNKGNPVYLEVKSAVLRGGDFAMYPDCPTLRGQKHVEELMSWASSHTGRQTQSFLTCWKKPKTWGYRSRQWGCISVHPTPFCVCMTPTWMLSSAVAEKAFQLF